HGDRKRLDLCYFLIPVGIVPARPRLLRVCGRLGFATCCGGGHGVLRLPAEFRWHRAECIAWPALDCQTISDCQTIFKDATALDARTVGTRSRSFAARHGPSSAETFPAFKSPQLHSEQSFGLKRIRLRRWPETPRVRRFPVACPSDRARS